MQLYAYFYDMMADFPPCKFEDLKTVTTKGFFSSIYRLLQAKVHIHHSHVSGEIFGYAHDFCNWKVRENKYEIPLIGHNFLGFDIFYMVKGYRSSCWGTKEFSIGGTNLTNVNYANVKNQIKIIGTLRYYRTTLAGLTSTSDEKEKKSMKKSIIGFFNSHHYFSNVWFKLNNAVQDNILELIAAGKGVMPYELIKNTNSLSLVPDKDFFDHTEFFSSLKQQNVTQAV